MDKVLKLCDAMEGVTVSAATIAPRCFSCGNDEEAIYDVNNDRKFDPKEVLGHNCSDLTSKFASRSLGHSMDENSVRIFDLDNGSDADFTMWSKDQHKLSKKIERGRKQMDTHPDDETNGAQQSWASDEVQNQKSKILKIPMAVRFEDQPLDDDGTQGTRVTNGTYGTYDGTYDSTYDGTYRTNNSDKDPGIPNFNCENLGYGLFGIPMTWTHVVKKKSSWSSKASSSTSSTKSNSSSGSSFTNKRDPSNNRDKHISFGREDSMHDSLGEHYHSHRSHGYHRGRAKKKDSISTISSKDWDGNLRNPSMNRELPSFGKSREFRSFGSSQSKEERSIASILKPTYISAKESKKLHDESNQCNYIIRATTSDLSSQASKPQSTTGEKIRIIALTPEIDDDGFPTTTIPYSSLSQPEQRPPTPTVHDAESPVPSSKRTSFNRVFGRKHSHFPMFH